MSVSPAQIRYIEARAVAHGLDPQAVFGIFEHEDPSGQPGDNNTSFGPFQLHAHGALPANVWSKGPEYAQQWAWTPQGIDYALSHMAQYAKGLKGQPAVDAISRFFERPADPTSEITDAMSHYGSGPSAESPGMGRGLGPTAPPAQSTDFVTATRQQALAGLTSIAQGEKPTDEMAPLASLVHSFGNLPTIARTPESADPSSLDAQAVKLAQKYIGVKYTWGGTNAASGFDCSGLVQTVWKQLGVNIPRTTYEQWDAGKPVTMDQLRAGDAVYFTGVDPKNGKPGHEGLYIGNGKFIEAPGSGQHVHISNLAGRSDFVGARRFG